jgi:hypothetical protein
MTLFVLLVGTTTGFAQVLDRGEITGNVQDETGAALPGVTITLTHLETGLTRVVVTNASGQYRAPLLPVGPYRIEATLAGFATLTREGVVVTVGSAPVIDLTLPLASVTEAITVTAETPIVETSRAVTATTLNQEAISTLPINGRDFRDFALLSPSVQQNEGLRASLRFGGQSGDYGLVAVDGADQTNAFFAEYTGSAETQNFTISQEAVQEFQVLTNGFNAEFGRSTGGVVNVVTKSGTNETRASGFGFFRDSALRADDAFGNPPTDFSVQQYGGSIGGPIARDKAFYFFAFDAENRSDSVITQFRRDVSGIAIPEFGIADFGALEGPVSAGRDLITLFGKVDFDLSDKHRLSVRVNYNQNETKNFTARGTGVVAAHESNFEDFTNEATSFVTSLTSVIGTRAFNEFKFQYVDEKRPREAKSDLPEVQIADTCTAGCFGREFFLPINGRTPKIQFYDSFSYLFGSHDVKFGVDWNSNELSDNFFIGWARGSWLFNTLEDFQAGQNELLNFRNFFAPFSEDNIEVDGYWTHELGIFIQDKWQPASNLTVSYGIRYEAQYNGEPKNPIAAPDGTIPLVRQAPGTERVPVPQDIADDTNNWAPRFGVTWDPTNDGRTVVRGSAGLYFGRTASIFFPTGGSGFRDSVVLFTPPPAPGYPVLPPSVVQPQPGTPAAISFVASEFQNPRVFALNLGVEREVAENVSLGVDFIYSETENARIGGFNGQFDMNTFAPTGVDEFGRNVGVDVFTRGRPDPQFFGADMLSSLGRGRYKAVTVTMKKAFTARGQFQAHYTWSKDESNADAERDAGVNLGVDNLFDVESAFGIDERDIPHRFVFQGTADVGAGFTVSGIATFRKGRALAAQTFEDVNGDGVGFPPFDRPVYANGNIVPRFPEYQPNFYNVDLRVMYSAGLGSAGEIDLLFEIFNLLNNSNFTTNSFVFDLPNYGQCSADPSDTTCDDTASDSRSAQIGIKWRFPGN